MSEVRLGDIQRADLDSLIADHDLVLLDAFGVLLSNAGPLPGAIELIESLAAAGKEWFVVTNDASKNAATSAARYRAKGLPVPTHRVITSGSLLPWWFESNGLAEAGLRCVVMGPQDSVDYVREGGGVIIEPSERGATLDALIVADDMGYPLLETFDAAITMVFRTIEAGRRPRLVLPNPDLIYPKGPGAFGITAGSVALVIQAAIDLRYPELGLTFEMLGKPYPPIFEAALAKTSARRAVMFGDQLHTDVAGANRMAMTSVLLTTGVTRDEPSLRLPEGAIPSFVLPGLA